MLTSLVVATRRRQFRAGQAQLADVGPTAALSPEQRRVQHQETVVRDRRPELAERRQVHDDHSCLGQEPNDP
jgi:hypothetical protein